MRRPGPARLSPLQCGVEIALYRGMKFRVPEIRRIRAAVCRHAKPLLCVGLWVWLIGCASTKIDWNSRIGNYTYDQAVVELGPPDKSAKLSDGSIVAEWMTRRGYSGGSVGVMYGSGYPYYHYHPWYHFYEPPSPDYFIRLTFGPDGKLQAYKRVVR